ncbi:MAG TPA: MXAN_2562 family outer membrane beta-barrel protein [Anaeromyxobacteraceae bacterium]|nr:MXAN_2562 family outer membrane beta-barrel protein [Anaeromyxobacteraceae bacterium]
MRRAALAALLLCAASGARAAVDRDNSTSSGRWGAFQLSFSTFAPNIDSEFTNGTQPYETVFGTTRPLLVQVLFSRSVWISQVGSLDVGLGIGYWKANGTGYSASSGQGSQGGSTSLTILPVQLAVGYRFDVFYDQWGIPFAPYLRGAIVGDIWWTSGQGAGSFSPYPANAQGTTWGWAGTLGLALVLDALDPSMARQMDYDTGINHTMLFFDFTRESVNNFGAGNSWQLAPSYWMWSAGILFVF